MKEKLTCLIKHTQSNYYKFPVVAILECIDGTLFNGVNIETSSPQAGSCAERVALYSAIANGYNKNDFKCIHLMAKNIIYPCFICRQALIDYCPSDMEIKVYVNDSIITTTVRELCNKPFSEGDLK